MSKLSFQLVNGEIKTVVENKVRVSGCGWVDAKQADSIEEGDKILFTGGSYGVVKAVIDLSAKYLMFSLDTYNRFGVLQSENTGSRKYKKNRQFGIKN